MRNNGMTSTEFISFVLRASQELKSWEDVGKIFRGKPRWEYPINIPNKYRIYED